MPKPRYLISTTKPDGRIIYRYHPPEDAIDAGVVKRVSLGTDFEQACVFAEQQNNLMDEWRSESKYLRELTRNSRVEDLVKSYMVSMDYIKLGDKTKRDYSYYFSYWYNSRLSGVPLIRSKLCNISTPLCQRVYEEHAAASVSLANHSLAVYRLLFNYGIRQGFIEVNPFKNVKPFAVKPRKVVWERNHVRAFLSAAYSEFDWRNVGVIVNMAYEWGQRLGDMRTLTWDEYDVDEGVLTLTQSKRGASIKLPTSNGLQEILKQQHRDYAFQKYIAPAAKPVRGKLNTYSINQLNRIGKKILVHAGLPEELRLMDLRRSAITEMVEVGVPLPSIMAMSGHATPSSLTPYIKNTLRSATTAQQMRDFPDSLL